MSDLQNDKDIVKKRKAILQDDEEQGLKVTASLRDQQLAKLTTALDKEDVGPKIVGMWHKGNADRSEWLERMRTMLQEVDEFIEPIYDQALDWSSTLHLPTILTVCKTYHARMYAALMSIDPPFTVKARKGANADRAMLVEQLVRYTLKDWCNENEGVEDAVDRWLWDWITRGVGLLKGRWYKKFTRYADVETRQVDDVEMVMDEETGDSVPRGYVREVEEEVVRTEQVFNGPMLERIDVEDVVIVGGEGDPQKADAVIHRTEYTASELWSLSDQKVFNSKVVEEIVNGGKDTLSGNETSGIKQDQRYRAGEGDLDQTYAQDRYVILETYLKYDVDGSGIAAELIVWVHEKSKKIVRATYLRRVMPEGKIPFFKADFHHRHNTTYSVGLIELLYSLGKEIDAMHNIKIDTGILSSLPFGFYRPTATALKDEQMPIEPGALIPVDNPQADVYFPNLGMRTSFGFQEEAALQQQIERLTSISDLNLGVIGGQGAARTATGARALLGESSNNLNVFIQRMNRPWKRALRYMFCMLQHRIEPGFQFRLLGDDGNMYWETIKDRRQLEGMFDFELEGNSANSNKQIQIEQANMLYQMTSNPIDLQLGLVTPSERFEAIAYLLKVNGIKDISKFVRKPMGSVIQFSPLEIMNRILAGIDVPVDPTQDWQGYLALVEEMMNNDEILGQFGQNEVAALVAKAQEAQGLMQAMQQAQGAQMAAQQQQMNAQAAQVPQNNQPVAVNEQPVPGEGG